MRPHPTFGLAVLVVCMLAAVPTFAASQPRAVFPTETFTRTTGPPNLFTRSVTVAPSVAGPYTLTILNGQPDGTERVAIEDAVTAGRVVLNGVEVVGPSEFSRTVARIDKTVTLNATNVLEVHLSGAPASFIRLSITGVIPLGDLTSARTGHTASLLADGSVLIAGGEGASGALTSAERFDPLALTFGTNAGNLGAARSQHSASVLADKSHLLAAGQNAGGVFSTAELFDPSSGLFADLPDGVRLPRSGHTATVLLDGRVLIAGGRGAAALDATEQFDPQAAVLFRPSYDPSAGGFTLLPQALAQARWDHTATLLPSGKVLILGGRNDSGYLASGEWFDPATEQFTALGSLLPAPRAAHTATLLPNGTVLILGGRNDTGYLASGVVFDPATGVFTAASQSLITARANHTATLLYFGEILIAGGESGGGALAQTELYGPPAPDATAPTVAQGLPAVGATGVDRTQVIGVRFSEPVDVTTLHPGSVQLAASPVVDVILSPSADGLLLFVLPETPLTAGTTYTLTLTSDIADLAGNPLAAFSSPFTTVPAPIITAVAPNQGAAGTAVTLTGQHFDPSAPTKNVVKFGPVAAVVTAATATELTTTVPAGAAVGPVTVTVTTRGGTAGTAFTVTNPVPTLALLSPASAVAGSGAFTLTLTGGGFLPE